MDHILANDGNPVPDLANVTNVSEPPPQATEDEELEALRAQYGTGAAGSAASEPASGAVAQVCDFVNLGWQLTLLLHM
jgi:hypothetical protein